MFDRRELKNRETRVRRRAKTKGSLLIKSRSRDPLAEDYGTYYLAADTAGNRYGRRGGQEAVSAFSKGLGMTLDQIERELS